MAKSFLQYITEADSKINKVHLYLKIKDKPEFLEAFNKQFGEVTKEEVLDGIVYGKYTIREDGTVDVDGGVNIKKMGLKKIPFKFGIVEYYFYCDENELSTLEGAPEKVNGAFDCSFNRLASLEGAPREVDGVFYCGYNNLQTLKGAPEKVSSKFFCENNKLTSLNGSPKEVGSLFCGYNLLTSLEGAPKKVVNDFYCQKNKVQFTKEQVRAVSKVGGHIHV
jgi:hypothetical protein